MRLLGAAPFFIVLLCVVAFAGSAVLGGALPAPLPLFPADNWWNIDISAAPVDPNSAAFIGFVGSTIGLHPDFGAEQSPGGAYINGIPYIVVDGSQPKKTVEFEYADESDGDGVPFYPIPDEAITQPHWIESGPPGNVDLRTSADRHMLIVDRDNRLLYELYNVFYDGTRWHAGSGAFFDMKTNNRRPDGWTSADAAGLAILPGLVRYDEVFGSDEIRHAFRMTVRATNSYYVYPASHRAGSNPLALPMGARLRLKSDFNISGFSAPVQKILRAMKKHGMIVADNGSDMYFTGTYDPRWVNGQFNDEFRKVTAASFEVVKLGYRSPSVTFFPHVVVGGGYSTAISLVNTGDTEASGSIYLWNGAGTPLPTTLAADGTAIPFAIRPAGALNLTAGPVTLGQPATSGWARIESLGGTLSGVATFYWADAGTLKTSAGVFASQQTDSAVLPVDNNDSEERYTGFAIANPGTGPVNIRLMLRDESGAQRYDLAPASLNPLPPGGQVATFVHQLLDGARKFRGTMSLSTDSGGTFAVVALVQSRGQITAIPVVSGR